MCSVYLNGIWLWLENGQDKRISWSYMVGCVSIVDGRTKYLYEGMTDSHKDNHNYRHNNGIFEWEFRGKCLCVGFTESVFITAHKNVDIFFIILSLKRIWKPKFPVLLVAVLLIYVVPKAGIYHLFWVSYICAPWCIIIWQKCHKHNRKFKIRWTWKRKTKDK